jgi:outer membrane protein OmpA-like peptidoglycan-associated protein
VPEKAKPEKVVLVRGEIRDEEGEIVRDAEVRLNFVESKRVERVEVDKEDGTYATIINVDTEPVVMTIEKEGHAFQAQLYTIESAKDVIVEKDVEVKKFELGKPYTIDDIYYATNSAEIDESSKLVLDQFASYLKAHPKLKIAIHGHTDNVGSNTDNQTLSTERAFEVMNYLQYKEVPASSITFKGFGSSKPIADNSKEEGRAKNRRTEFIITKL